MAAMPSEKHKTFKQLEKNALIPESKLSKWSLKSSYLITPSKIMHSNKSPDQKVSAVNDFWGAGIRCSLFWDVPKHISISAYQLDPLTLHEKMATNPKNPPTRVGVTSILILLCRAQNVVQNPKSKIQTPKSKIQNPKSEIQNPKSKIQNPKSKIQNPKSQIQNPKSKIQNPKSEIQNPKSKIPNPKSKIQNLHKKNCYIMPQNPKSKIQNPKSKIQNPKSKIRNPKSKIQNPKSEIQNPKSKIQNPKSKIQNPKSKIPNPKSEIQNPKSKIQIPKSKIRNPKSKNRNPKSKIQIPKSKIGPPEAPQKELLHSVPKSKIQIPKSKIQNPQNPAEKVWILDFGLGNFGFWIPDFGFWIPDFGFWILDFGFWRGPGNVPLGNSVTVPRGPRLESPLVRRIRRLKEENVIPECPRHNKISGKPCGVVTFFAALLFPARTFHNRALWSYEPEPSRSLQFEKKQKNKLKAKNFEKPTPEWDTIKRKENHVAFYLFLLT